MITSGLPACMTFSSTGSRSLDRRDLLLRDQDVGVLEDGLHAVLVGDEVGRDVALVELHTLDELELEPEGVRLLDGDDAVLADLVHRLGNHLADLGVVVRARSTRRGRSGRGPRRRATWALIESTAAATAFSMPRFMRHRVGAGGDVLQAGLDHRLGEHGGGGGSVTGDVVGLGGDFFDELGAHVLPRVLELDLFGDRHAVVRDRRRAPLLVEHDVAALGAERYSNGVGEPVDSGLEALAGFAHRI